MQIFNFIKAKHFFPQYAPSVKDWRKKMTGKNGRGNPIEFTEEDKKKISTGISQMTKDFISQIKKATMKSIITILALITMMTSCSKATQSAAVTTDTVNITITATSTYQLNNGVNSAYVTTNLNPSVSGMQASVSVGYDVYDSTVFKYHKVSIQLGLPAMRHDTISTSLIKPVIMNVAVDTASYSQSSVPANYLVIFNY